MVSFILCMVSKKYRCFIYISIQSTYDEVVGDTAPSSSYGTFLQIHEIISGAGINNLKIFVYVPVATTFGQVSFKIRAIKFR